LQLVFHIKFQGGALRATLEPFMSSNPYTSSRQVLARFAPGTCRADAPGQLTLDVRQNNMTPSDHLNDKIQPASADRAIRIGFCVIGFIFSYFAVRLSLSIGGFGSIFADMLGGKPLPHLTQFVLQTGSIWVTSSLLLAVIPFGLAFVVRRTSYALYAIAGCIGLQILQAIIIWTALSAPLFAIINGMRGA
jgi:hypothetical protein